MASRFAGKLPRICRKNPHSLRLYHRQWMRLQRATKPKVRPPRKYRFDKYLAQKRRNYMLSMMQEFVKNEHPKKYQEIREEAQMFFPFAQDIQES